MEFDTDHRPVVATVALKLKRSQKREDPAPRYNILRLRDPEMQQRFAVEVSNRFSPLADGELTRMIGRRIEMK